MTEKNTYDVTPYQRHNAEIIADTQAEPLILSDVLRQMGLSGPRIPAAELVGKTFTILRAKPFISSFDETRNAWFCVIVLQGDEDPYTTVIGGAACTEILEAVAQAEYSRPLQVTLEQVDGGRYGRYYQFV